MQPEMITFRPPSRIEKAIIYGFPIAAILGTAALTSYLAKRRLKKGQEFIALPVKKLRNLYLIALPITTLLGATIAARSIKKKGELFKKGSPIDIRVVHELPTKQIKSLIIGSSIGLFAGITAGTFLGNLLGKFMERRKNEKNC